jgi:hypothetical protein
VIAHSLGTVIASNYLYDLEVYPRKRIIAKTVRQAMGKTPLDRGETLASLYTLGSPIAMWSLRYENYGIPVAVPSPKLAKRRRDLETEWVNFYDQDDIIGYPLRSLNDHYRKAVNEDIEVNTGNIFTSWNPASHTEYWTDNDVTVRVAEGLARLWKSANRL